MPRVMRSQRFDRAVTDQSNLEFELAASHFMGPIMVRKLSIRGTEMSPTHFRIPVSHRHGLTQTYQ